MTKDTTNLDKRVSGIYYYHPDHLGSATWLTNASGNPVQFIHYMPWGELWYNQQASAYNERFKFTGKERDTETGYDYFGARYYSSALPMWLSVDPLSDKYPNISPYAYCNWNPINSIDPDGKRCRMIITGNTITLQAKYYVRSADIKSAKYAINFWNKQNNLQYTDNAGNTYSVRFNLSVQISNDPRSEASISELYSNSYEVVHKLSAVSSQPNTQTIGLTSENYKIEVRSDRADGMTGAHEVGHTLMNADSQGKEHSTTGIMTQNALDSQHGEYVSQETVNTIIETNQTNQTNYNSLWSKIKSLFE